MQSGSFLEKVGLKRSFGHTGEILGSKLTKASFKKKELAKKFIVVDYYHEIINEIKKILSKK